MLSNLLFTLLGVILGWIPQTYRWARDRFTSTKAPSITFSVRPVHRPGPGAVYQCKIFIDIRNELPGQPVRLARAYFVFNKNSPLRPDPKWSHESKTKRFHLCFFSPPTKMHDWRELNSLAHNDVTRNSDLNPIYQKLVGELNRRGAPPILTPSFAVAFWKFFSGASFWFVLLVLGLLVGAKPDDESVTLDESMTGLVMLGLFFGIVGVFLPFISPLWNYLSFPLAQVLLFFLIVNWWRRRRH